jgi:hypothetical protein
MKKIYLFIAIAFVFVSCQSNAPQNMKVINLTVNNTDWVAKTDNAGLNRYYSAHFSMPEITSNVYASGSVEGYFVDNGVQESLPYVRHFQNASNALWTRTVDFDYSVGGINVYVTNSDFVVDPPTAMNFRIVLIW